MCHDTATNLVQVYHQYRQRNVVFVSLSMDSREVVQSLTGAAGWPSGFGVHPETMQRLGVFSTEFAETFPHWGG